MAENALARFGQQAGGEIANADYYKSLAHEGKEMLNDLRNKFPRVYLAQANSEEVSVENHPIGSIIVRNVPGRDGPLVAPGIDFTPLRVKHLWVKWPPKVEGEDRAGVAPEWAYDFDNVPPQYAADCVWGENGEKPRANETWQIYAALWDENGNAVPVVMSFDRTATPKTAQFLLRVKARKDAPMYALICRLSAEKEIGGPTGKMAYYVPKFEQYQELLPPAIVEKTRALYLGTDQSEW